jgi:hypothetical protein
MKIEIEAGDYKTLVEDASMLRGEVATLMAIIKKYDSILLQLEDTIRADDIQALFKKYWTV